MLANLDTGGGDLRFSSDEAGTTQLACEVVTFTKATGDVVWVKVPAVSTGALIYVWGDNTGAIQPAVDAAFGRNAVWVDYHVVTTDGVTDRTGNTTLTNANLSAGATFNGVQSVRFNGVSSRIDALLSSISHPFAMSVWCDFDVLGDTIMGVADKSVTNRFHRVVTSSTSNSLLAQSYAGATRSADSGIDPLTGGFRFCAGVYESASSRKITIDSSAFVTNTATATTPTLDRFTVGTDADSTPFSWLDGDAIYFKLYNFAPSQAYLDVEYDNQSAVGSWWTATDEPSGGAIELTPTTINSNSQSFNPTLQYTSLLSLAPSVVNSASSALNPVIQYSASLLLAPSIVDSASSALNPALQYASVVLLEPATVNSASSALNPNISFSAALNIFPNTVDSSSISLDPVVKYISALDLLPGAVNSNSVSLDPVVNYTSILNISPSVVNSNSVSFNPSIDYTSALILSPVTVNSSSVSLDPLVEYKAVINITSQLINSASVSLNPSISTGATQDVGLVSAGFANDLYSVQYEASGVTASYQLSNISVNFKG
jgi:hypothetical protein